MARRDRMLAKWPSDALPELGQTLLAYGRFKLGDDAAEGQRLITRARGIFARMGAVGWVAETDTAPGPR